MLALAALLPLAAAAGCALPAAIDPGSECTLYTAQAGENAGKAFGTLDVDSVAGSASLSITGLTGHTDHTGREHPATVGAAPVADAANGRYVLDCEQPTDAAGPFKTLKLTVQRPTDLGNATYFGAEVLHMYRKDQWTVLRSEQEPYTFNDYGSVVPLGEFRADAVTGLEDNADAESPALSVFMAAPDDGDFVFRYNNPNLVYGETADATWTTLEFSRTLLRVGTPWATCGAETSSAVQALLPAFLGHPNLESQAYADFAAAVSTTTVPTLVVLDIFSPSAGATAADGTPADNADKWTFSGAGNGEKYPSAVWGEHATTYSVSEDGLMLKRDLSGTHHLATTAAPMSSGVHYVEMVFTQTINHPSDVFVGMVRPDLILHGYNQGYHEKKEHYWMYGYSGTLYHKGKPYVWEGDHTYDLSRKLKTGDKVGLLLDLDALTLTYFLNGAYAGAYTEVTAGQSWLFAVETLHHHEVAIVPGAEPPARRLGAGYAMCYQSGTACPDGHTVCSDTYCHVDRFGQIQAALRANPLVATLGYVETMDGSTPRSQAAMQADVAAYAAYAGTTVDGYYFGNVDTDRKAHTDEVLAVAAGAKPKKVVFGTGQALTDPEVLTHAGKPDVVVTLTADATDKQSWNPFAWFPDEAPTKFGAVVTDVSDVVKTTQLLFDRGYGTIGLHSAAGADAFTKVSANIEAALAAVAAGVQGRRLQAEPAGDDFSWGCDAAMFTCQPVCLRTTGFTTVTVADGRCEGAPDACSCPCLFDAGWACRGEDVVCEATHSQRLEPERVGDLVCSTRGADKPAAAELRAGACARQLTPAGSYPSAECLERSRTAKQATAAPAASAEAQDPAGDFSVDADIMSFAAPAALLAVAALA